LELLQSIFKYKNFHLWKPLGWLVGAMFIPFLSNEIHPTVEESKITLLVVLELIWGIAWVYKQRIPRTSKNKIGILICIHSKDANVDDLVREDFISNLKRSFIKYGTAERTDIIVAPYHIASKFSEIGDAVRLLEKSKGHFLLFGNVRKRGSTYILDLTANVRHSKLNEESTAWISRYRLPDSDESFEKFELSSDKTSLFSRYILGLAAFASSDFTTARHLFETVKTDIRANKYEDIPAVRAIKTGVSKKLNSIYLIQAHTNLNLWVETRKEQYLNVMDQLLVNVYGPELKNARYLTLCAIIEVALRNNIHESKKYLNKVKPNYRDLIWQMNLGFLRACEGKEDVALVHYNHAIRIHDTSAKTIDLAKISEFEEFICWYIEKNNFPLSYFLLGTLNERFKGDAESAIEYYRIFIGTSSAATFSKSLNLARESVKALSQL
jgi:tetratricopeptide (TPR) repeat protein